MQAQQQTFLDLIKTEGPTNTINPNKQESHKIGYNYVIKFMGTEREFINNIVSYKCKTFSQHIEDFLKSGKDQSNLVESFKQDLINKFINDSPSSRLKPETRRWKVYQVFKKFIDTYDSSKYSNGQMAARLDTVHESHSKFPIPNIRTSLCSLIGRILILANKVYKDEMSEKNQKTKQIRKNQNRLAKDKKIAKMNTMIHRYGESGFNRLKKTQKAASNIRKAAEVTGNVKKELEFVEWRRSVEGKSYDKVLIPGILKTVSSVKGVVTSSRCTNLGSTDFKGMSEMVRKYISKSGGLKIEFDVQDDDATTTLYQHVYIQNMGLLPLKSVQHFRNNGIVFKINKYYLDIQYNTLYVNLDYKTTSCHRLLPKKWGHFENWKGYGIVGNPKHDTKCYILVKILPTNIKMFQFTYEGKTYRINHTRNTRRVQNLDQIEAKIMNKYDNAYNKLKEAAKEQKKRDSRKAREKARSNTYDKVINDFFGGRSTLEQLTELLTQGKISEETYKKATKALN